MNYQTGPRTEAGKAASSMNAVKRGHTARHLLRTLNAVDTAVLEKLRKDLVDEHQPATTTETMLVLDMADAHFRLERIRLQQDRELERTGFDASALTLLERYARAHERTFFKALETFKKMKAERVKEAKGGFVSQKQADGAFFQLLEAVCTPPTALPRLCDVEELLKIVDPTGEKRKAAAAAA